MGHLLEAGPRSRQILVTSINVSIALRRSQAHCAAKVISFFEKVRLCAHKRLKDSADVVTASDREVRILACRQQAIEDSQQLRSPRSNMEAVLLEGGSTFISTGFRHDGGSVDSRYQSAVVVGEEERRAEARRLRNVSVHECYGGTCAVTVNGAGART